MTSDDIEKLKKLSDEELISLSIAISNEFDQAKQAIKDRQIAVKAEIHLRSLMKKLGGLSESDKRLLGIPDQSVTPPGIASDSEVGST